MNTWIDLHTFQIIQQYLKCSLPNYIQSNQEKYHNNKDWDFSNFT